MKKRKCSIILLIVDRLKKTNYLWKHLIRPHLVNDISWIFKSKWRHNDVITPKNWLFCHKNVFITWPITRIHWKYKIILLLYLVRNPKTYNILTGGHSISIAFKRNPRWPPQHEKTLKFEFKKVYVLESDDKLCTFFENYT